MSTEDLVARVAPTVGDMGWGWFRFYFLGRGGVLGDVEAPVVVGAFGYFKPALVTTMWDEARQVVPPRQAGREFMRCSQEHGRRHFSEVAELESFCQAAEAVVRAANPAGLALFAGAAAEPLPDDPPGRAMQLVTTLRELRGSVHLLAVVASGVEPRVAHAIRRPDMWEIFGWEEAERPAATDDDRARLTRADRLTDELLVPAFSVLDEAGADALVTGLERMEAALALGTP